MAYGIDTSQSRIDLLATDHAGAWSTLKQVWLGGGDPPFVGRNFVGGDWLWMPAEATNASGNPNPDHQDKLSLLAPLIAPMQAPQAVRQALTGRRGFLCGALDGEAICRRLIAAFRTRELTLGDTSLVDVWLCVDPATALSADYWAGWSSIVNTTVAVLFEGDWSLPQVLQPFRAALLCQFDVADFERLTIDPRVHAAVAQAQAAYPSLTTAAHGYWADCRDPDVLGDPNPALGWTPRWERFDDPALPDVVVKLWRCSTNAVNVDGTSLGLPLSMDAIRDFDPGQRPTDFMLDTWRWQPSAAGVQRVGVITHIKIPEDAARLATTHPLPRLLDRGRVYTVPSSAGFPVAMLGRYSRALAFAGADDSMQPDEPIYLSNLGFELFSIREGFSTTARGFPSQFDPDNPHDWDAGWTYFVEDNHTGTGDAKLVFPWSARIGQAPHTPIYFAVDMDIAGTPAPAPSPALGAGTAPGVDARKADVERYFREILAERDAWTQSHPERPYLIGVYGSGTVLDWCYRLGFVSYLWQTESERFAGSEHADNHWPWHHAHRWQYQDSESTDLQSGWHNSAGNLIIEGADPDSDWGDGGTWSLSDPFLQELNLILLGTNIESTLSDVWGNLLDEVHKL